METSTIYNELLATLSASWQGLPDKPEEDPRRTLHALWLLAAGRPLPVQRSDEVELPELGEEDQAYLRQLVDRRLAGVPLAYLTGWQSFLGLELRIDERAMIPRKETELLASSALPLLHGLAAERGRPKVLDLCCGSGNLALAMAFYEPGCVVWGSDIDPAAVELARANAGRLGLAGRVEFFCGDLFKPFEGEENYGQIDLVLCNPPYISSARAAKMPEEIAAHEPRLAFDGGIFGVNVLTCLAREAPRFLRPASWLCFEVGLGQGEAMMNLLAKVKEYGCVTPIEDANGSVRVLMAQRAAIEEVASGRSAA